MKGFEHWVSDMADSIPDASYVNRERDEYNSRPTKRLTARQIRLAFIETAVPHPTSDVEAHRTIILFCKVETFKSDIEGVLGYALYNRFQQAQANATILKFYEEMVTSIKNEVVIE